MSEGAGARERIEVAAAGARGGIEIAGTGASAAELPEWIRGPADVVGRMLLGAEIVREVEGERMRVRIVETEAYDQHDPASHSYRGPTPRTAAMFLEGGHAYVYLSHGIHHCLNVVAGPAGFGAGVLIRAAEPVEGADAMLRRRGRGGVELTNGPGKLAQALEIDLSLRGHDLRRPPLRLIPGPPIASELIDTTPRIGVSKGSNWPRRYTIAGNPFVSKARTTSR